MFGLAALLISAGLWKYQSSLTTRHRKIQREGEAALATSISGAQLRQELSLVREALRRIEENFASEDNFEGSLTYFYTIEGRANARLEDQNPLAPVLNDSAFKRVPFALKISGTYPQVAAFLNGIETGPKPTNISYFSLRRRSMNSSQIVLDINLDLLGKK
jgi:Tfp pilus assembly protein PilO